MAELFQMMPSNCPDLKKRQNFFTGKSCFPLSPHRKTVSYLDRPILAEFPEETGEGPAPNDQLITIFNKLGSPDDNQTSFISNDACINYLRTLPQQKPQDLESIFPGVSIEGLDLLSQLLQFNPYFRPTASQSLEHAYFKD